MEFMGIAVGILALICALVLLFGRHGTRRLLGWGIGILIFGWIVVALVAWANAPPKQTSWADFPVAQPAAQPAQPEWSKAPPACHYSSGWGPC